MAKQFTLGKNERLKSRKAIEYLFKEGKRFIHSSFRVHYVVLKNEEFQFGAGVSTKNFKKAVDRNRVKRLIRESYRQLKLPLKTTLADNTKGLHLFVIYTGKELPDYSSVYFQIEKIIKKLQKLIHENPA